MDDETAGQGNDTRVLVVDDEEMVADTFAAQLNQWYDAEAVYGGEAALERVDAGFDIVLLDRRMPHMPGDEVLAEIRDRDIDVQVVMVTAVDADFDVLSMPCDGYAEKPVDGDDLQELVEQQLAIREYDDRVAEFFATTDKLSALELQKPERELADSDEYAELKRRQESLREDLDQLFDDIDDEDEWLMV